MQFIYCDDFFLILACYSIFAWDCTASASSASCPQVSTNPDMTANYNISLEFNGLNGLTENVQMIVISECEKVLAVDSLNNWSIGS